MPLDHSESQKNVETSDKEWALREEVGRLKKLLEVKERELKSSLENSSLKNEILLVREKIKARSIEYGKIIEAKEKKEKNEDGKETEKIKETLDQNFEDLSMQRKTAPSTRQLNNVAQQAKASDASHQLSVLINVALTKDVYQAVKIAKKIGNAYLMDRFHDIIVNEYFEKLVKSKKMRSKN